MNTTKRVEDKYRGHSYSIEFEYAEVDGASPLVGAAINVNGHPVIPSQTAGFPVSRETEAAIEGSVVRYINFLTDKK